MDIDYIPPLSLIIFSWNNISNVTSPQVVSFSSLCFNSILLRSLDLIRFPFRMINRLIYHSPCVSEKRRIFARIVPCINKIIFNSSSLFANQRMESLIHRLNNRLQKKSVEIFNYIFLLFFFLRLINDHRENRKEIRITIERMNERDVDSMAFL